jgi:hypothetical protein
MPWTCSARLSFQAGIRTTRQCPPEKKGGRYNPGPEAQSHKDLVFLPMPTL